MYKTAEYISEVISPKQVEVTLDANDSVITITCDENEQQEINRKLYLFLKKKILFKEKIMADKKADFRIEPDKFNVTESGQVIKADFRTEPDKFNVTESGQVIKEDIIGHPNHYCEGRKYEPKDVIRDWNLNFNLGNTVKYISRNGRKDGNSVLQDLKKARQYLDFEIEYLESKGE